MVKGFAARLLFFAERAPLADNMFISGADKIIASISDNLIPSKAATSMAVVSSNPWGALCYLADQHPTFLKSNL
jgi:hypothetical protein